jgi:hypothetical protein
VARSRRGLVAVALAGSLSLPVLAAPALPVALAGSGCTGSDCGGDTQSWGSCTQGERLDENTWESGPVTGAAYLDFRGERTWVLDPSLWMGSREPIGFEAYLSLDPQPNADGGEGFALPAGNLAEFTAAQVGGRWQVSVLNDTCAQYYLRVVLTYAATDAGAAASGACEATGDGGAG